ncbi:hypothetical protein O7634_10455 [Micromonospora sp. WMMD1120]|uniref:hypothetical protein n=1 Tax=Micromonospora sp. WMMD1120 TaxID=3016106 RepID=UPI00241658F3|nr:hypothetical protein [Micromonospora sp. WMMD1120]MDG4807170.1 hypothetical protein [Micromonospora sp. WMMD1120]
MFELLTGDDLYAEVLLLLDDTGKGVVLVEGPDDVDTLDTHVDEDKFYLIPGYGKTSVVETIALVDADQLDLVLAILDRDWVGILDEPNPSSNVVYTDMYDLDSTVMLTGDSCSRVVTSFCKTAVMKKHVAQSEFGKPLEFAIRPAVAVGAIRLITREHGLNLRAREFPVAEIMDFDGGHPNLQLAATIAISKAAGARPKEKAEEVLPLLAAKYGEIDMEARYCSGHDIFPALAAVMKKRWGGSVNANNVAKAIRAAFSCAELMRTSLYRDVEAWAESRSTYVWNCPEIMRGVV